MFVYYVAHDIDDDAMKVYTEENMCKVHSFENTSNPVSLANKSESSR